MFKADIINTLEEERVVPGESLPFEDGPPPEKNPANENVFILFIVQGKKKERMKLSE